MAIGKGIIVYNSMQFRTSPHISDMLASNMLGNCGIRPNPKPFLLVTSATYPSRHHRPCRQSNASNPCAWPSWGKSGGTLACEIMSSPQNRASNSENHIESEKIHQELLKLGALHDLHVSNLQNHHVPFKTMSPSRHMGVSQNWAIETH